MPDFEGVVPAIITPMFADGEINEDGFRAVMEDNIQAGVHGFWTAGGTGESVLLTDEENHRIARAAVDQNQGRTNVIMHGGAQTTVRAARNAEPRLSRRRGPFSPSRRFRAPRATGNGLLQV